MTKIFDVGIIGAGVAGAFAALRAAEKYKKSNVVLFDLGRPPGKRRRQLEGWLGCFPFGDGKIHVDDIYDVMEVVDGRRARPADKWVKSTLAQAGPMKVTKDKLPPVATQKRAFNLGFDIYSNDFIQWKPESVHKLSRVISETLDSVKNIELSFDNEVHQILKKNNAFEVTSSNGDYICKKIVLCVGRSGWRWANDLYKSFGLSMEDNTAKFGIRIECAAQYMKDFNKSHCSFIRNDLEIGPLNWNGTIIPEDHADLVISAFRSNEDRWKSDKVSFSLIGNRPFKDKGVYETERLGKLAFLLFNDRIGREKIKTLIRGKSPLSQLPEYNWLTEVILELEQLFPSIISRGYFHSPTISPTAAKIQLSNNLEADLDGLFVAGESAGFIGIGAAAISGVIALDNALK